MALEEDLAADGTSAPDGSTSQVPLDDSEVLCCPICIDTINDEASINCCRHKFCFPCILDWSCVRATCPICLQPFSYICRKVADSTHEVYRLMRCRQAQRRSWFHNRERRRHRSSRDRHRRAPSSGHGSDRTRAQERTQGGSSREHHDVHSRGHYSRDYTTFSSRSHQQRRAQDTVHNAAHDQGRASRHELEVVVSTERSEHRQHRHRDSSRERHVMSQSWHRSRSPTRHQQESRHARRSDSREGPDLSPEQHSPTYSHRSEGRQRRGHHSSQERHHTRNRSPHRYRSPARHQPELGYPWRRNDRDRQTVTPELQMPDYSQRSRHRSREGHASSRERHESRSQSRHSSRSPARHQVEWEHSRRRDGRDGRTLSSEHQSPSYSQGSKHQWQRRHDSSQ